MTCFFSVRVIFGQPVEDGDEDEDECDGLEMDWKWKETGTNRLTLRNGMMFGRLVVDEQIGRCRFLCAFVLIR